MAILTASAYSHRLSPVKFSADTPAAGDPRQTKVVLPKKKPEKWSNGVSPGEYGGPPTTTKLRKYWGGKGDEDPVTATDDFIWNKEFVDKMKRLIRDDDGGKTLIPSIKEEQSSGFLSLNRAMSLDRLEFLNSLFRIAGDFDESPAFNIQLVDALVDVKPSLQMVKPIEELAKKCTIQNYYKDNSYINRHWKDLGVDVDLSKELMPPPKPVLEQQVEAARHGLSASQVSASSPRWRLVPTRREQAKWDRANKAATGGSDVMLRESKRPTGDPKVLAAQAREEYFKLKKRLQLLTLGIGGVGMVSAYVSYTPEIAASFGAGLIGSLIYIRMLGNTVDSMADGARGLVKGAAGQPRLLVPLVLVMVYNRWNGILVPDYGAMHLELIPMLVGFFTYKIATFAQAIQEAVTVVEEKTET